MRNRAFTWNCVKIPEIIRNHRKKAVITLQAQTYEYPLPNLALDIDNISIDSNANREGSFTIKNTGGGLLSGHIISRNRALSFSPDHWEGNSQIITYTYSPEMDTGRAETGYSSIMMDTGKAVSGQNVYNADAAGSVVSPLTPQNTHAYICSNGGEIPLPITINFTPMTIPTDEGLIIATISDFYNYAQDYPAAARRLFTSSEFYMLLLSTGYEYMDIYESLHKDVNRERAMDNFFILSGLKTKTLLTLDKKQIDIVTRPSDKISERFHVQKSGSGYADAPITALRDSPWLTLSTDRLTSSDFDKNNRATVGISIDPLLLASPFAKEYILVGPEPTGDNILEVTCRRATPFILRLNRAGYRYEDRGSIEIENNTGSNMTIEVYCRDRHVRFFAAVHPVGARHSIPFEIRPSAFASARRLFRRLPYISTYIDLRATCTGQVFHRRLHLNIGEW